RRADHIDTGILGAKYVLNALLENGRAEVAFRIAAQKTLPGWGWWMEQGATTLWESWRGTDSLNHIMFGDISAWVFKALAGARPRPRSACAGFPPLLSAPAASRRSPVRAGRLRIAARPHRVRLAPRGRPPDAGRGGARQHDRHALCASPRSGGRHGRRPARCR